MSQLQTGGSSYVPIPPVRVLDTRPAFQIGLSGAFHANTPRTFQVGGAFAIPATAIAVTGNVTIANQTGAGYVSVTPTAVANPTSSTINFPLGDTRANNLTVPLAPNGKLAAVYKAPGGKTTHLIVDITGYFLPGDEDATYAPITPVRALDSRFGIGLGGAFAADSRPLNITGLAAVPADATAITGNLTVVGQTKAGYLSITKTNVPNPTTSTLNFPLGDTRANGISVPLNAGGGLWIVYKASGGSTHVILDVTGYYRDDPAGLLFYPLTPGRVMDTRPGAVLSGLSGPFNANGPRRLDVAGHWGAPSSAEAVTGNLTVVGQTAAGYVSATLDSETNPTTSVLNFPLGDNVRTVSPCRSTRAAGRGSSTRRAAARRPTSSSICPATSGSRLGGFGAPGVMGERPAASTVAGYAGTTVLGGPSCAWDSTSRSPRGPTQRSRSGRIPRSRPPRRPRSQTRPNGPGARLQNAGTAPAGPMAMAPAERSIRESFRPRRLPSGQQ